MQARAIEESGVVETLDAVDRLYGVRVEAEAATFVLAAHFADLMAGEGLPVSRRVLPGRERAVRLGGEGTPLVAEFAAAEFGARVRMGSWAARHYLADALDVRHRLPLIWARVVARQARVGNVRLVAARTRHLSVEAAGLVDRAMVDFVDGSVPWGRFESRLAGRVVAADPETAAAREEARVRRQFAKRTRCSEEGTAGFYVRSSIGVIARLEATVLFVAEALRAFGDTEDLDRRKVKAVVVLCNPGRAVELLAAFAALRARTVDVELPLATDHPDPAEPPDPGGPGVVQTSEPACSLDALGRMDAFARRVGFTPTHLPPWLSARPPTESAAAPESPDTPEVAGRGTALPSFVFDWSGLLPSLTLNLHVAADTLADGAGGVVRWEGEGPVTHRFVHEYLRPLHAYRIQPVIDLAGQAPVDAYEIPDRHRRAVLLRTPADAFPYSSRLAADGGVDIDHTHPWQPAGPGDAPEERGRSRLDNYGPLGRFHHRIKTHGHWTVRQPFEGIELWRDPHGQIYLVDHTGTHKVTRPGTTAGAPRRHDHPSLELHPADGLIIELDQVACL